MEQNAWKIWRANGLGSSDAPVVMGVSPWTTRYQLWEEKTGLLERDISNWATRRGNELEPLARAQYELEMNCDMPPVFFENKDYPQIRASLDGFSIEKNIILEIKCPGKDDIDLAKRGLVPEKYWPQLQHQLLVTGSSLLHYYTFDGEKGYLVEVKPDLEYMVKLLGEELKFWELVKTKTPPEFVDKDFKKFTNTDLIEKWKAAKAAVKTAEDLESIYREKILKEAESHARWKCDLNDNERVTIVKSFRQGNVDYSKIPEIKNIALDQYRKKGTTTWTIRD